MKADNTDLSTPALLADLMMGRSAALAGLSALASEQLLEDAEEHGVLALADRQLARLLQARSPQVPDQVFSALQEVARQLAHAAREEALVSMQLEAETRRVLQTLSQAGTTGLLLKGSALAYWAYEQPHLRRCSDVDLLLPSREAAERLAEDLSLAGYIRSAIVSEPVAYELTCRRRLPTGWEVEIDIHWRLNNSALFADLFDFDELMQHAIALPRLDAQARALGPAHALVHACTHRALNLATGWDDHLKWLYDLIVLVDSFSEDDWKQLIEVARRKQLAGVVLSGLEAAADTFRYNVPANAVDDLRQAADDEPLDRTRLTDWRYIQWQTFLALRGHRARWLWQRAFPSRARLTNIYGEQPHYGALMWLRLKRAVLRLIRP